MDTAQKRKKVFITDVGSYLGSYLADSLLAQGTQVYGAGKNHPEEKVLTDHNFTFVDVNFNQPLPQHLESFDLFIHLTAEKITSTQSLNTATKNIISLAKDSKSKVFLLIPIRENTDALDSLFEQDDIKKNLKIFLVGDVYGPGNLKHHHSYFSQNTLTEIVDQAEKEDKIVLEKEGMENVYPLFIKDAIYAINKFIFQEDNKTRRFLVSQNPLTTLSASYEIQNITRLKLEKELGIFFKGTQESTKPEVEPIVRIPDLGYSPKFKLHEGLQETFSKKEKVHQKEHPKDEQSPLFLLNQKQDSEKKEKKVRKLPKFNTRFRSAVFALIIFLLLISFKFILDIYSVSRNLNQSKDALIAADFDRAKKEAHATKNAAKNAQLEFQILTYPLSFIMPGKTGQINDALTGLVLIGSSLENFSEATKHLSGNLHTVVSTQPGGSLELETPAALFNKSNFEITYAQKLMQNAQNIGIFKDKFENIKKQLEELNATSSAGHEISTLTEFLTGKGVQKTYLVLLLNNSELRPGGGFIGNYGEIVFKNAKLQSIMVDDIYNIDGQLKEKIEVPKEITQKLGPKQLYLRDSNWSLDFSINAKTARDFYKKETGKTVDGVIAFDLTFAQSLLEKMGPIRLAEYNEEITAQNLFEKGEYYAEVGFFPGSTQKKDFFSTLANELLKRVVASLNDPQKEKSALVGILQASKDALSQKHLMLSFDDENLQSFTRSRGWDNPVPPLYFDPSQDSTETRDYLALSEANLGANKANRFIERKVDYEMTIGRDADLVANLEITYKNNSQANTWPAGTYTNFLRVYTPLGTSLEDIQNGQDTDLKKVQVSQEGELTVFSTFVEVPIKGTKTVKFTYRVHKSIKLEKAPTYSLFVQKQPGTEKDPLKFSFNLPGYLTTKSINTKAEQKQNLEEETDLSVDRHFTVDVAKK